MNFDNILGLHVAHGDEIVLAFMGVLGIAMYILFRKKNGFNRKKGFLKQLTRLIRKPFWARPV